jgi:hypothetical protein
MKLDEESDMGVDDQPIPDDPRRQRLDEVIGAFLIAVDLGVSSK